VFSLLISSLRAIVVAKGPHTLIVGADGQQVRINLSGNSGLGTAGTGDVLTGIIASMLCHMNAETDAEAFEAVVAGVFVHGMAGDVARERLGEDGMTAEVSCFVLCSDPTRFIMNRSVFELLICNFLVCVSWQWFGHTGRVRGCSGGDALVSRAVANSERVAGAVRRTRDCWVKWLSVATIYL
jgi:hypothetical protein